MGRRVTRLAMRRAEPVTALIRGARLLDPVEGLDVTADLLVHEGAIAQIGDRLDAPEGARVVDGAGKTVLPGLVDLHTHLREPGREDAETIRTGTQAAARGGYTAVHAMANTTPTMTPRPICMPRHCGPPEPDGG